MNPRSAAVTAAFYPAVIIAGWTFVSIASPRIEASATARSVDRLAPSLAADVAVTAALPAATAAIPQTTGPAAPATDDVAKAAEFMRAAESLTKPAAETTSAPPEQQPIVVAALGNPAEIISPEVAPAQAAPANTADTPPGDAAQPQDTAQPQDVAQPQDAATTARPRIELVGECLVIEPCIDQYLFAVYERTPKEDTIKETERSKVTIKRKGKMVTVTRTSTKMVENDFGWKDPKAAERAGMSMSEYVIGGMDRSFKLKLFRMLYAADAAGLQPGITSAFRDDYRQSIASGLKAASDRSYHGGSSRGGYGHGLAADLVSVNGANRAQRWHSTEAFWKWVDANGKQFGIGRPYLDHDPPHVGPTDGLEYISRRGGTKTAGAEGRKRDRHATQGRPSAAKRPVAASSSKQRTS